MTPVGDRPVAGVWTLAGDAPIIADPHGPATLLVRTEEVLLLAVDLPLATHAKRLAALPFAIEDRIADPVEAVHLAIGTELSPRRYLVGVVRHTVMARWIERAAAAGIADSAFVPDALTLPVAADGGWVAEHGDGRVVVRSGDGTGFALPAALMQPAYEAAGRPGILVHGDPLPDETTAATASPLPPLSDRVVRPALNLRQGAYAVRSAALPSVARKVATILAAAAVAHAVIAAGDAMMLRAIAERRAETTRSLLATAAPGVAPGDDVAATAADLLPRASGENRFVPTVARLSAALGPVAASIAVRSMAFDGRALVVECDATDPGIVARVRDALSAGGVTAQVAATSGGLRIQAPAA